MSGPPWPRQLGGALLLVLHGLLVVLGERLLVGYLTGSDRRPYDHWYHRPGLGISGAITLARDELNADDGLLGSRGHGLDLIVSETFGEEVTSIRETAALWTRNVSAFIGPQETCVHEAKLAAAFNLPMVSHYCTNYETSDKKEYPTFARTRPPDTQISKSVAAVCREFNWTHVSFVSQPGHVAEAILRALSAAGVRVAARASWDDAYHHGYSENPFLDIVRETHRDTRIYIVLGGHDDHIGLLTAMESLHLFDNGEYWVVGVDAEEYTLEHAAGYLRGLLRDGPDAAADRAFRHYLGVRPSPPPPQYKQFQARVAALPPPAPAAAVLGAGPGAALGRSGGGGGSKLNKLRTVRPEAAYLYDAVQLYARAALAEMEAGRDPRNGTAVVDRLRNLQYRSAMGFLVHMDANADAEGNYTLLARRPHPADASKVGLFPVGGFQYLDGASFPTVRLSEPLWWPAGQPPVAEPACGFRGERCIRHTGEIAGGVAGSLVLLLLIAGLVVYRNWRYEQELDSLLWKVDFRDIKMAESGAGNGAANGGANGAANGHIGNGQAERHKERASDATDGHQEPPPQPPLRTSQVSLSSNPDADFRYSCIYTTVGVYRGRVLAVKKLGKTSIDITRAIKKELKLMKDLRHDNLNAFIGACVDPPNVCIVTEYCTRGSLKDILENEDVKLDNMFIASLVGDILRGMIFLHDSPLRFHGNLKSSNCLVDSRWVVKVADFGLHELKRGVDDGDGASLLQQLQLHHLHRTNNNHDQDAVPCKCDGLLYRAPELLRAALAAMWAPPGSPTSQKTGLMAVMSKDAFAGVRGGGGVLNGGLGFAPDPRGSQKGDVYAFAIVLYEIQGRHGPYGDCALAVDEVLRRVLHPEPGQPPYRPPLDSLENSFDFVRECLQECWAEDPEQRPDLKAVRARLRPLRKGMKPNIFDNMIAMMEKYANNLEVLVDERTDQLQQEKRKTEALLYEMLPRCVADQLKRGQKVQAESFDSVTIYFSDIVGFTAMSAQSTPLQVVDFLNDLYTCFDSTIGHFDVYKIETIGDAYMVVSGLPVRNGDSHAAEVASMSLQLLEAVKTFRIRHRPGDALQLRIGIHSGPVCAGVVGLKMPRYCLFGDTVNTASRMESNGMPLRIHCSPECAALLQRIGGYELAERGLVRIKGKGDVRTYWLLGESEERRLARQGKQLGDHTAAGTGPRPASSPCATHGGGLGGGGVGPRSSLKKQPGAGLGGGHGGHGHCAACPPPLARPLPLPLPGSLGAGLTRCSSLESPKRLRFASSGTLHQFHQLDSIADHSGSPGRVFVGGGGSPGEGGDAGCLNVVVDPAHLSASCPAIDHLQLPSPRPSPMPSPEGAPYPSTDTHTDVFQTRVRVPALLSAAVVASRSVPSLFPPPGLPCGPCGPCGRTSPARAARAVSGVIGAALSPGPLLGLGTASSAPTSPGTSPGASPRTSPGVEPRALHHHHHRNTAALDPARQPLLSQHLTAWRLAEEPETSV